MTTAETILNLPADIKALFDEIRQEIESDQDALAWAIDKNGLAKRTQNNQIEP